MDLVFFRAMAKFIKDNLPTPDMNVFIDEEVNRQQKYPAIYMIDIDEDQEPQGCGRVDFKERDVEEKVIKTGKMYDYKPTVRFTIVAPQSITETGGSIVARLAKELDQTFIALKKKLKKVDLIDPISLQKLILTYIKYLGQVSLPPDVGGDPVLYQRALSFRFTYQWNYEQDVDHAFENIIMVYPETP